MVMMISMQETEKGHSNHFPQRSGYVLAKGAGSHTVSVQFLANCDECVLPKRPGVVFVRFLLCH